MEHQKQPSSEVEYIDLTDELLRGKFAQAAREVERDLQYADVDIPDSSMRAAEIADATERLNYLLGLHYQGRGGRFTGAAYPFENSGKLAKDPEFLSTDGVTFHGVEIAEIAGVTKVVLDLELKDTRRDEFPVYRVTLDDILSLELHEIEEEGVSLDALISEVRRLTTSEDFFNSPVSVQKAMLETAMGHFDDFLRTIYDNDLVAVSCDEFYTVFDDAAELDMSVMYRDQTGAEGDERFVLRGMLHGAEYPELREESFPGFRTKEDFVYSDGVPCITLRDDKRRCTYFIKTATIADMFPEFDVDDEEL